MDEIGVIAIELNRLMRKHASEDSAILGFEKLTLGLRLLIETYEKANPENEQGMAIQPHALRDHAITILKGE